MPTPRKDHNLVMLADGHVLAVGGHIDCEGIDCDPPEDESDNICGDCEPALQAIWIDPNASSPFWEPLASMTIARG
jgi:hypothetical protein